LPRLYLQRNDRRHFFDAYRVYVNRGFARKLPFGNRLSLALPPGRYALSIGGWRQEEIKLSVQLEEWDRAYLLEEAPKAENGLQWREVSPIQLPEAEVREELRRNYARILSLRLLLELLLLFLLFVSLYWSWQRQWDLLFLGAAFFWLAVLYLVHTGIKNQRLRRL